ncbi:type II secretion system protein N [Thalassococcus sp. BH17M4-6]|uniref:type II secretion system protein N n=1 Tax=Thalassococcus sp. BH17M4-6 TaxID=3413148 RepID=UPI003BE2FF41
MKAIHLWMLTALVFASLAVTLAQAGARLGWHLAGRTSVTLPDTPVAAARPARATSGPGAEAIQALAPFGSAEVTTAAPQATAQPLSALGLELRGVFVDRDPARSKAFIARSGKTAVYRIGAEVADQVTLQEITDTHITLDQNGALQKLYFRGATPVDAPTPEALADATPKEDPMDRLRAAIRPGRGSLDLRETPNDGSIDGHINMWRERINRNPAEVMETIGLEATGNGYTIRDNPNIGVTLAGLKTGDLVTRVNGQQVGDPTRDRTLYDEIAASGIARLEVVRDGSTLMMSFPLR